MSGADVALIVLLTAAVEAARRIHNWTAQKEREYLFRL